MAPVITEDWVWYSEGPSCDHVCPVKSFNLCSELTVSGVPAEWSVS